MNKNYMQYPNEKRKLYVKMLGEIVKRHRLKTKKSIYLIAAESSVAKSSWREIELGIRTDTSLSTFCKISEGLDIEPCELLMELTKKLGKDFSFTDLDN